MQLVGTAIYRTTFYHRIKSSQHELIQRLINPAHSLPHYSFAAFFNIILRLYLGLTSGLSHQMFSSELCVHSSLSYAYYILSSSYFKCTEEHCQIVTDKYRVRPGT
jgi:hypothetical protein